MLVIGSVWEIGIGELGGEFGLYQGFDLWSLVGSEKLKTALEEQGGVLGYAEAALYFSG